MKEFTKRALFDWWEQDFFLAWLEVAVWWPECWWKDWLVTDWKSADPVRICYYK